MFLRGFFAIMLFSLSFVSYGQEDSIRPHNKNQFLAYVNFYNLGEGSWWGLQYRRLMKKQHSDTVSDRFTNLRYWFVSASATFEDFGPIDANDLELVQGYDSIVEYNHLQRVSNDYDFRFGKGNQFRLLTTGRGGLQSTFDIFGVVGVTHVKEKFSYLYNAVGNQPSDAWLNANNISINDAISMRSASYLRLGIGALLGLDWVLAAPSAEKDVEILIGLQMGLTDASIGILVHNERDENPELPFTEDFDEARFHMSPNFNLHVGVSF
ncbi:MAG: hypothetical protein QNK23_11475 [Crocinitomicaceae bacterium]|nr:hypothetical protein [Crocinitomicaceae bacterium]